MSAKVSVKLDAASKILQKRGLGPGGRCQKLLAEEVARLSEPYIPQNTGNLADSVRFPTPRRMPRRHIMQRTEAARRCRAPIGHSACGSTGEEKSSGPWQRKRAALRNSRDRPLWRGRLSGGREKAARACTGGIELRAACRKNGTNRKCGKRAGKTAANVWQTAPEIA